MKTNRSPFELSSLGDTVAKGHPVGMDPNDVNWPDMNVRLSLREKHWGAAAYGAFLRGVFAVVFMYGLFLSCKDTLRLVLKKRALKFRKWLTDKISVEEMRQAILKPARNPFPDSPLATLFYEYEQACKKADMTPVAAIQAKGRFLKNLLSVEKDAQKLYVLEDKGVTSRDPETPGKELPMPRRREAIMATRAKKARSKDRSDQCL